MILPLRIILGGVVILGLGARLGAAEPALLTLEEALGTVEGVNLTGLLSRETAAQAVETANIARVGILQNIALSGQQRRTDSVSISGGVPLSGFVSNRFDGLFTGSYNLFSAQAISALQSARAGVGIAQADYRSTLQLVLATWRDRICDI